MLGICVLCEVYAMYAGCMCGCRYMSVCGICVYVCGYMCVCVRERKSGFVCTYMGVDMCEYVYGCGVGVDISAHI